MRRTTIQRIIYLKNRVNETDSQIEELNKRKGYLQTELAKLNKEEGMPTPDEIKKEKARLKEMMNDLDQLRGE